MYVIVCREINFKSSLNVVNILCDFEIHFLPAINS